MPKTTITRAGLVGALLMASGVLAGTGSAEAIETADGPSQSTGTAHAAGQPAGTVASPAGVADVGEAGFTKGAATVSVPPVAPCAVEGPESGSSGAVSQAGITFGGGTSSCTTEVTDPADDVTATTSTATGKNFELAALVSAGGRRIKLGSYTVTCKGVQGQTSANWTFNGLSGITDLPSPMPVNYAKPLTKADGTLLATANFNVQALPGDGGIDLTMLRIDFAPGSGATGSVSVGHTACAPTP
ncbi:hypothetical protein [Amycolatopsis jiangsuensis]|uniref:Secreted protein n=1 Tax=Amycolatopsis jiangsuensis TaxID=1181879 RepID=A0A840IZG6_9PSEU|nr:hypothetical protein [Amycolatopsis jiangsuensis]MBB4686548.1 hypothetical protein [Amycolatopsis jiangsuensis]